MIHRIARLGKSLDINSSTAVSTAILVQYDDRGLTWRRYAVPFSAKTWEATNQELVTYCL